MARASVIFCVGDGAVWPRVWPLECCQEGASKQELLCLARYLDAENWCGKDLMSGQAL